MDWLTPIRNYLVWDWVYPLSNQITDYYIDSEGVLLYSSQSSKITRIRTLSKVNPRPTDKVNDGVYPYLINRAGIFGMYYMYNNDGSTLVNLATGKNIYMFSYKGFYSISPDGRLFA